MPSRSSNSVKSATTSKKTNNQQTVKTKQKPQIKVTHKSPPEDILHASWEFLSAYQFFKTFSSFFSLPSSFSVEKLEQALMNEPDRSSRESSVSSQSSQTNSHFLANFFILTTSPLLSPVQKHKINTDNYQDYLLKVFPETRARFSELTLIEKIKFLKAIENTYMETGNESFVAFKNEHAPENLRAGALGVDEDGWTYWHFGDTRLYRELPIPNGKRGVHMMTTTDFTFELVCSTIEEWRSIVKKFETSSTALSVKICNLSTEVISKLESREAAIQRNIAKLKRARELELIPRKKSRRLEAKSEEEAKKQEELDIERQKAEYEEFERKKREREEKAALEQEKRDIRIEEARLKNEIHDYITNLISSKFETDVNLKELKNQMSNKATEQDYVIKMRGWVSLLSDDITLHVDKDNLISFRGNNISEALEFNLFKNTLRTFIIALLKFKLEPEDDLSSNLNEIYKKLLLKKYNHIDSFCLDLNNVIATADDNLKQDVISLLSQIFRPSSPRTLAVGS